MAIGTTAAILGAGALGAGASILGSSKQSKAAKSAGDAELKASLASVDETRRQYDLSRSDLAPFRDYGVNALAELSALYGIGRNGLLPLTAAEAASAPPPAAAAPAPAPAPAPAYTPSPIAYAYNNAPQTQQVEFQRWLERNGIPAWSVLGTGDTQPDQAKLASLWSVFAQQGGTTIPAGGQPAPMAGTASAPANALAGPTGSASVEDARNRFTASPGYQFRLGEGVKAVQRSAAARGLLGSGGTLKAVQRFGEGLASNEFDSYANRLASIAGIGQTATTNTAQLGAAAAGNIGNALTEAGNARASSFIGQGNAAAAGFAGVGNSLNSGVNNMLLLQYLNRAA